MASGVELTREEEGDLKEFKLQALRSFIELYPCHMTKLVQLAGQELGLPQHVVYGWVDRGLANGELEESYWKPTDGPGRPRRIITTS